MLNIESFPPESRCLLPLVVDFGNRKYVEIWEVYVHSVRMYVYGDQFVIYMSMDMDMDEDMDMDHETWTMKHGP